MFNVVCIIIGIIGGNRLLNEWSVSFFIYLGSLLIVAVILGRLYGKVGVITMGVSILMGCMLFMLHPINKEASLFQQDKVYLLCGKVQKVDVSPYAVWITLNQVTYEKERKEEKVHNRIKVELPLNTIISEEDFLYLRGRCLPIQPQMNPSDFNNALYLKSQGIIGLFKSQKIIKVVSHDSYREKIKKVCQERIDRLYGIQQNGILSACLIGEKKAISDTTKALYNKAGIGHVLAISGFHIGIIIGLLIYILGKVGMPYIVRQLSIIIGVWCYTLFTGSSISTLRGAIMVTFLLMGRCLWQEEDEITNLALAAGIILCNNPYQLFQVGFQLSFIAVLSIIVCLKQIESKELFGDWEYPKWQKALMIWGSIQIGTWPILAYHFFEVPFLISILNLIIIPLFSLVIVGGWLSVVIYPCFPIAYIIAVSIEKLLSFLEQIVEKLLSFPLATLCIGRPTAIMYFLYTSVVVLLFLHFIKKKAYKNLEFLMLISIGIYLGIRLFLPQELKITALYVGQGDSIVIELPNHQVFLIDGGNIGQGKVIRQYLLYRGKKKIDAAFLSHSDADHINGLIELVENKIPIGCIFISVIDNSENLRRLMKVCNQREVAIVSIMAGDKIKVGSVSLEILAPQHGQAIESLNDCSMVQVLKYKDFKAVFTGDRGRDLDTSIYDTIGKVTLLKVSHHGSRTGTDNALLLKLRPSYAMISCGINNRYNHPHQQVLTVFKEEGIPVVRTDQRGMICYKTNGKYLTEETFREEVVLCP